jgi:hypothetical protein
VSVPCAAYFSWMLKKKSALSQELKDAREKIKWLEAANKELSLQMCTYRSNWINECRRADALEMYGPLNPPSLSQAGWTSPSPDRSYGT